MTFCSSMRSANLPASPLAPGRSSATKISSSPFIGIQRNCTFRNQTIPFGPQYSSSFGKMSGSMKVLQYCPAPKSPSSPQACRNRNVVWPASSPTPNNSNSKTVFNSPYLVGVYVLTPNRVCRTLSQKCLSSPNSPANDGNLVGRTTSNQSGLFLLKSKIESSIVKP